MKSADGKGRTLFEMLTGRNKRDMTAQELQVHNPLQAKVGWSVSVSYEADLSGYNFFVETIWVWETRIGDKTFYHTDYNLKATAEFFEPDVDVDEDEQNRWSLVWEFVPVQFVQLRTGVRSYDGIPQNDLQNRTTAFVQLNAYF